MNANIGDLVLPGDIIVLDRTTSKIVLGPGLREDDDVIYAEIAGMLQCRDNVIYWIDGPRKRYVASRGEAVLGIVMHKLSNFFRVDIGASELATLSSLSFDGATKTNRPDVKIGDVIYGRLVAAGRNFETEIVCIDSKGRSSGFGILSNDRSQLIRTSTSFTRKLTLLSSPNYLHSMSKIFPYEITIGCNGRIWVKGRSIKETQIIVDSINAIENNPIIGLKQLNDLMSQELLGF